MLKFHKCDICREKFKASKTGRLQIIKKTRDGKKEIWVCRDCVPLVKEKLKELNLRI
ncbi:MAG: hypothetical protein KAU95_01360 [Candidatus Aenigmarchaeota archaeon]|nr:hypothetical protein [Candidatus Aenigmarchaeota archaeon]